MVNSSFPLKPGPSTVFPISGNSNCNLLLLGPTLLESSLTPLSFSHSAFKSIRKYCWFYLENKPKIWPLSQHCCYYDHTQSHSPSLLIWVITTAAKWNPYFYSWPPIYSTILLIHKSGHGTPMIKWVSISLRVNTKVLSMAFRTPHEMLHFLLFILFSPLLTWL